jgi:hypothetical protein
MKLRANHPGSGDWEVATAAFCIWDPEFLGRTPLPLRAYHSPAFLTMYSAVRFMTVEETLLKLALNLLAERFDSQKFSSKPEPIERLEH